MEAFRAILREFGEYLIKIHGGIFSGLLAVIVTMFNLEKIFTFDSIPEMIFWAGVWTIGCVIFVAIGEIGIKHFGRNVIKLSEYYPDFWYLPKVKILANVTTIGEIELVLINRKNQRFTLAAGFHLLESKVDPLPDQAWGVAPDSRKELLPLDTMTGRDKRTKKIGRVDNRIAILSAGVSNGEMVLEKPGTYQYWVKWYGEFRGRWYEDGEKIIIRVTEKRGVIIDR